MKRLIAALILCALLALTGCAGSAEQMDSATAAVPHTEASVEGTVFTYDGTDYEITERCQTVNSLEIYGAVDINYIIVDGHINPKVSYYGAFNTETRSFEKDLLGGNLTFYRDKGEIAVPSDVETGVYSFWNEVLTYDGEVLATYDVCEPEFISNLSYSEDGGSIEVTIQNADGESERSETLELAAE